MTNTTLTKDDLQAIEQWASQHVVLGGVVHPSSEENRRRDQVMRLVAEVRELRMLADAEFG